MSEGRWRVFGVTVGAADGEASRLALMAEETKNACYFLLEI